MTSYAIRCLDLFKAFGAAPAVQALTLEVQPGECLALLGPSGCGKTTLLRLIAGFEVPDSGQIAVGGRVVAGDGVFVPPERRRVGIVFQDHALFPHLDVAGNVGFGLPRGRERRRRVQEMLALVGLRGYERRMPHQLSGGEQQRVALARALAPKPEVVLLDEPFSSLDADLRARTRADMRRILAEARTTVVMVTHDQQEALYMGDRVAVMRHGRIEQVGSPWEVYHRPETPFVAEFVGVAELFPGAVRNGRVWTEVGELFPLSQEPADGEQVRVLLRPNCLNIRPTPDGPGVIVERSFQGSHFMYRVRLPSGAQVQSLLPCACEYPVGTRVELHIMPEQALVCFAEGRDLLCELRPIDGEGVWVRPGR